jgi:hypothetical protein
LGAAEPEELDEGADKPEEGAAEPEGAAELEEGTDKPEEGAAEPEGAAELEVLEVPGSGVVE